MGSIKEKVQYIKGLMDGLNIEETDESKVIRRIVEVLDDIAEEIEEMEAVQEELQDYVETLDYDLGDVEQYLYEGENDEEVLVCPNCEEEFYEGDALVENDVYICPYCQSPIEENHDDHEKRYEGEQHHE